MQAVAPETAVADTYLWDQIYLARQPILDTSGRLIAFELLFRGGNVKHAEISDNMHATGTVLQNLLAGFGMEAVLGRLQGYLNVDREFLMSDLVEVLPAKRLVLEVLESVQPSEEMLQRISELRKRGFRFAMDDFDGALFRMVELAPHMDIIKVDLGTHPRAKLPTTMARLKGAGMQLLAKRVETHDDYQLVKSLGFELFQGYFFAKPQTMSTKVARQPEKVQLLRLLNLIITDAEIGALEAELKRQPVLGINLLRLANSAAMGRTVQITSIRHALAMLGRKQLSNWLQLMIYAGRGDQEAVHNPLLQMAAARAKLMELVMNEWPGAPQTDVDAAFMTGMLSLVDVLLNISVKEVVTELKLPPDMMGALLERSGRLGKLLQIASALDEGDPLKIAEEIAAVPGLDAEALMRLEVEAFSWASQVASGASEPA